jgi:predicted GNAT superfamily acetyltransferase
MIGFVFGFVGLEGSKPKHCSLMCGVISERRYRGVGYQLKLKQREAVLAQGIELVTWTYDPLQSANAHFNFAKLGVIAQSYEQNLYGDIRDELNRGLPTDRLAVEWWVRSPRVIARVERGERPKFPQGLTIVNRTEERQGLLVNLEHDLNLNDKRLLVEIPRDIQALKQEDLELAQRWRLQTREIFEHYLERGYIISEFFAVELEGRKRGFYLLERASLEELLQ